MQVIVVPMTVVLAVVAAVVVAVLVGMRSRSWLWAVKLFRLVRQGVRYLRRRAVAYLDRDSPAVQR